MVYSNVQVERDSYTGGVSVHTRIASQSFSPQVEAQQWQELLRETRIWRESAERRKKITGYKPPPFVHKVDAQMGAKILSTILPSQELRGALMRGLSDPTVRFTFSVVGQDSDIISIPWETCSYPDWEEMGLDSSTNRNPPKKSNLTVLRTPVSLRDERYILEEPIEIMAVASNPRDILPPNFIYEEHTIDASLHSKLQEDRFQLVTVDHLNEVDLKDRLKNNSPQILHIMAHGESGRILAENTKGELVRLDGQRLASIVREAQSKKLVLFISTACELMKDVNDRFSVEVGTALANVVPFTIGMQLPVSPEIAQLFSQEFYSAVAASNPIIDSYLHARENILDKYPGSSAWIAPVLYVASFQDYIFFEKDTAIFRLRKISKELEEPITALSINPENKMALKKVGKILTALNVFFEHYKQRTITARLDISGELEKLVKIANTDARTNWYYLTKYTELQQPEWFFDKAIPEKAVLLTEALRTIKDQVDELCILLGN